MSSIVDVVARKFSTPGATHVEADVLIDPGHGRAPCLRGFDRDA